MSQHPKCLHFLTPSSQVAVAHIAAKSALTIYNKIVENVVHTKMLNLPAGHYYV